jgi:hypothetical protein
VRVAAGRTAHVLLLGRGLLVAQCLLDVLRQLLLRLGAVLVRHGQQAQRAATAVLRFLSHSVCVWVWVCGQTDRQARVRETGLADVSASPPSSDTHTHVRVGLLCAMIELTSIAGRQDPWARRSDALTPASRDAMAGAAPAAAGQLPSTVAFDTTGPVHVALRVVQVEVGAAAYRGKRELEVEASFKVSCLGRAGACA